MTLGIGGATPHQQDSNHGTAANHRIRDTSSYDHTKQTKVKCTSCGMWATRGQNCGFCKHPSGSNWLASPKAKAQEQKAPKPKEKVTVSNNALTHEHRDVKPFDHTKQTKIKCTGCGCWVKKGGNCTVCKRPASKQNKREGVTSSHDKY